MISHAERFANRVFERVPFVRENQLFGHWESVTRADDRLVVVMVP